MITIRPGSVDEVVKINHDIPEWTYYFSKKYLLDFLKTKKSLIVIAEVDLAKAGFCVCYIDEVNNYTKWWITGVQPKYRRRGLLKQMTLFTEKWSKKQGVSLIKSDVSNLRTEMQIARLSLGYKIVGFEFHNSVAKSKVYFEKKLK